MGFVADLRCKFCGLTSCWLLTYVAESNDRFFRMYIQSRAAVRVLFRSDNPSALECLEMSQSKSCLLVMLPAHRGH